MNYRKLDSAIAHARRFIEEAKCLQTEMRGQKSDTVICGTRQSGRVRRSSLDLTRNLAELRRPG